MSTVRVFRSTDPAAPAHPSATRGSMAALLRACLVEGYGSGSINIDSLSVSGGVGTASIATNTLDVGTRILIAGANEVALNAEWRITAADASSVTLDMAGVADQTASGTITASIPGAGWSEPYVETNNYACFQSASGGKFYQIDDNVDADVTLMSMFDSMSDAETGSGLNGTQYFGKYYSGKPTDWIIVADEKTCYVFLRGSVYGWCIEVLGEYYSYLSSDPSKEMIAGHGSSTSFNWMSYSSFCAPADITSTGYQPFIFSSGLFSAAPQTGDLIALTGSTGTYSPIPDVAAYDPSIAYIVHPARVSINGENMARGAFRGLYIPEADEPETSGVVFTHDGRDYLPITMNDLYSATWQVFVDVTGSWEESV